MHCSLKDGTAFTFDGYVCGLPFAEPSQESVGHSVLRNLIGSDFDGVAYPLNYTRESVGRIQAYASIGAVPKRPDLAIVCTPVVSVPTLFRQCGEAGVHGFMILSAGFREIGEADLQLDEQLRTAMGGAEAVVLPDSEIKPEELAAAHERSKSHATVVVAEGSRCNTARVMKHFESGTNRAPDARDCTPEYRTRRYQRVRPRTCNRVRFGCRSYTACRSTRRASRPHQWKNHRNFMRYTCVDHQDTRSRFAPARVCETE